LASVEHDLNHPRWWRVSGTQGLSRRSLAAVRELFFWREDVASRRDMPRRRVLRDDLIVSAASALPATEDALRRLRGFEKRQSREVEEVLDRVRRAIDMPESELPESRRPRGQQSLARMLSLLMEAVLEETCVDQQVDASLVGTASDLRELVRWHLAGREDASLPALKRGWRAAVCGDILEAVLAGEVHVSVADPAARRPLAIERADQA
jgi:ribonuclease D